MACALYVKYPLLTHVQVSILYLLVCIVFVTFSATTETKSNHVCSSQSYLSHLECLHNPTEAVQLLAAPEYVPGADVVFHVLLDISRGAGG